MHVPRPRIVVVVVDRAAASGLRSGRRGMRKDTGSPREVNDQRRTSAGCVVAQSSIGRCRCRLSVSCCGADFSSRCVPPALRGTLPNCRPVQPSFARLQVQRCITSVFCLLLPSAQSEWPALSSFFVFRLSSCNKREGINMALVAAIAAAALGLAVWTRRFEKIRQDATGETADLTLRSIAASQPQANRRGADVKTEKQKPPGTGAGRCMNDKGVTRRSRGMRCIGAQGLQKDSPLSDNSTVLEAITRWRRG